MSTSTRVTAPKRVHVTTSIRASVVAELAADLLAGRLAIFPTETVYGLGTSVFSATGVRRIYQLKGRQARKPLAVLTHSLASVRPLVESIPPEAMRLADAYCPGPLTLVFKASPLGQLAMGGLATIGVRLPDHPIAMAILRAVGIPLATTSVNRSGEKPAASGTAAEKALGTKVDWLIDGGTCQVKTPSSVVDVSHHPFTIIRAGAIPKRELEHVLGLSHR